MAIISKARGEEASSLPRSASPPTLPAEILSHDESNAQQPHHPFNWPVSKKWAVTLTACYVTFLVGWNATAITAAASLTNTTFRISDTRFPNSVWAITAWNIGAAVAPMVVLPVMEERGMRVGYLATYAVFVAFVLPQAVVREGDYGVFVGCRFVAGCAGGVLQGLMDGVIADVWDGAVERSAPVGWYVASLLAGVSIGPVVGGAVVNGVGGGLGWRWIFYLQLIIYGASAPLVFLVFRETRYPVIIARMAKRGRKEDVRDEKEEKWWNQRDLLRSLQHFFKENVVRPSYLLCTEAVVFFFTLLSGLSYGIVFISTQSVAQVYSTNYGFTEPQTGFVQASLVAGEVVGFLACAVVQDRYFAHATALNKTTPNSRLPEVRLYLAIPGSFLGLAGGLFWYGWTSFPHLSWWLPTAGLFLIGFGSMVVMQAIMMYVTDSYAKYAASASAAICFGENMFAAFLPLASQSMYTTLGFRWASSLLGFVALVLGFAPIVLVWKGEGIRRRSPFMKEAVYG